MLPELWGEMCTALLFLQSLHSNFTWSCPSNHSCHQKTRHWATRWWRPHPSAFPYFDTIPECDGQTHGRKDLPLLIQRLQSFVAHCKMILIFVFDFKIKMLLVILSFEWKSLLSTILPNTVQLSDKLALIVCSLGSTIIKCYVIKCNTMMY